MSMRAHLLNNLNHENIYFPIELLRNGLLATLAVTKCSNFLFRKMEQAIKYVNDNSRNCFINNKRNISVIVFFTFT